MPHFSVRERLGVGAAGAIVIAIGLGGWLHSRAATPDAQSKPPALAPVNPDGTPAAVELPAGGAANAAAPDASATTTPATGASASADVLVVHVAGAVRNPGVYKFKAGDRINDAVTAAGGFQSSADKDALNLADRLQDADQIYIPTREESGLTPTGGKAATPAQIATTPAVPHRKHALITHAASSQTVAPRVVAADASEPIARSAVVAPGSAPVEVATAPTRGRVVGRPASPDPSASDTVPGTTDDTPAADSLPAAASARKDSASAGKKGHAGSSHSSSKSEKFKNPGDGIVHLNSATDAQLEQLPGVGPAMSARILEYRTQIGKFTDPAQIMDVKGIGEKKYAKMQPFLAL